jgi:REP element-mobilizing transposase RayT
MNPQIPEKGSKALRKGRFSQKGAFYFITTRCYNKQKIFLHEENVQVFFNSIDWLVKERCLDLYFCIVMPDHVHLVFQLTGGKSLSEVMKSLKQYTGRKLKERAGINSSVWQEQYYDHLIRKDEDLHEIIKYCWYNPVRAGVVDNPKEYPYWRCIYDLE